MGSFGIFPLWGLLGAPARPPLLNPWWHGEWDGLGETGESVLKAGGIEMWSWGNGLEEGYGVTSQELFPTRPLLPGQCTISPLFVQLVWGDFLAKIGFPFG